MWPYYSRSNSCNLQGINIECDIFFKTIVNVLISLFVKKMYFTQGNKI